MLMIKQNLKLKFYLILENKRHPILLDEITFKIDFYNNKATMNNS